MKVVGFVGPSGVGKTTLIERLLPALRALGLRVSVIKHAHSGFDIDQPGKDSWRHRQAGAFEVLIASGQRLAKLREFEVPGQPSVHQLLSELIDCDWVLVEGFKHAAIPKIEVLRGATPAQALYLEDPFVIALATDDPAALPVATARPVLMMSDPLAMARFLIDTGERCEYRPEIHA